MTDIQWQQIVGAFARIEKAISQLKSQLDSVERAVQNPGGQTRTTLKPGP